MTLIRLLELHATYLRSLETLTVKFEAMINDRGRL